MRKSYDFKQNTRLRKGFGYPGVHRRHLEQRYHHHYDCASPADHHESDKIVRPPIASRQYWLTDSDGAGRWAIGRVRLAESTALTEEGSILRACGEVTRRGCVVRTAQGLGMDV